MKEWVRGVGSISTVGNPLTPTLSPNGERERTEFVAQAVARPQTATAIRTCLRLR